MKVPSLGQEDPRKRVWQHTPVFLPGESHGQRSLVVYSPWVSKESGMTEMIYHACTLHCIFSLFALMMTSDIFIITYISESQGCV